MGMISNEVIHVLNDLITLNKNRVIAYREVVHEIKNESIANHCLEMIRQGEGNIKQLSTRVADAGGIVEDKTTTSGFIYNLWMDIVYSEEKEPKQDVYDYCRQMEQTVLDGYLALLPQLNKEKQVYTLAEHQKEEIESSLQTLDKLLK